MYTENDVARFRDDIVDLEDQWAVAYEAGNLDLADDLQRQINEVEDKYWLAMDDVTERIMQMYR